MANMKFINPAVVLIAAACLCGGSRAWAADCAEEGKEPKAAATMSEAVYHGVDEATKLMAKQQHAEAIDKLTKLIEGGGDFDKAVVYYNLGFAYSSKNDYANAAK